MHDAMIAAIRSNFADRGLQLVYADLLEDGGDSPLADYVRFHADAGDQAQWSSKQWNRQRTLLDEHPDCWKWDNFLVLSNLRQFRDRILAYCDPDDDTERRTVEGRRGEVVQHAAVATDQQVRGLEELIGHELPLGYRAYLLEIGNGSAMEQIDVQGEKRRFQQLFSTETIVEDLLNDPVRHQSAKLPCELSWAEMLGVGDETLEIQPPTARFGKHRDGTRNGFYMGSMAVCDAAVHEADPDDHEAYEFGFPSGMLLIGELPAFTEIYLAVEGELAGTIWFSNYEGDAMLSYNEALRWLDAISSATQVRASTRAEQLPVDTLSGVFGLVMNLVPFGDWG